MKTADVFYSDGEMTEEQKALLGLMMRSQGLEVPSCEEAAIRPDPANLHVPFPLLDVQQAYVAGRNESFELGNISTHVYQEFVVTGLDIQRYRDAWMDVIERHATLRIVVNENGTQHILEKPPHDPVLVEDLSALSDEEREHKLLSIRESLSHQVLELGKWPLFEIRLSLLGGGVTRIHFSFDALLLDASSYPILMDEIRWHYENPGKKLAPLTLSFRDYVLEVGRAKGAEEYEKAKTYWLERIPELPPAPEFALDTKLIDIEKPHFTRLHDPWSLTQWKNLETRASQYGLTPTSVILAAFAEILRLWNQHQRFCINISLFNRQEYLHPEVKSILGDFTDLLLLAVESYPKATLLERARKIHKQFWQDMEHRAFGGVEVIREIIRSGNAGGAAIMPVVFTNIFKAGDVSRGAVLNGHKLELHYAISQTPQVLIDLQLFRYGDHVAINWDAVKEAFPPGQVDEMFGQFRSLLHRMADDETVWMQKEVVKLPDAHAARHAASNATAAPVSEKTLYSLFQTQAEKTPDNYAVITSSSALTYRELLSQARAIGALVKQKQSQENKLVAVIMEKGWEQIAAVLGILQAGAAYMPIDPAFPKARIHKILENSRVSLILTQARLADSVEWPASVRIITVEGSDIPGEAADAGVDLTCSRDLAYVMHTSGSTGNPKGVMIDHRGAVNTILDINRRFGVHDKDRVLALSDLNFDLSVYDIFGMLACGGALVLPDADKTREPEHWLELMDTHGVTMWNTVPMLMQMLLAYLPGWEHAISGALRLVLLSGDWIPLELPDAIRSIWKQAQIIALGGATEASIWSNFFPVREVEKHWKSIPYGKPLANQRYHILNDLMQERPDLAPGNLYIGGLGVAMGYLNDPERTRASFVRHPETGEKLYRTGDLGRWLRDGNIEFLGRLDSQVKIGGHRIELGEIEAAMAVCPGLASAVVAAHGDPKGKRHLVAYITFEPQTAASIASVQAFLGDKLPAYMMPGVFVALDALPLLPNGKINRAALPKPIVKTAKKKTSPPASLSSTEKCILNVWIETLGIGEIDRDDNFFELGGNSLVAIQTLTMLRDRLHITIPLRSLFDFPTVQGLASLVEVEIGASGNEEGVI